MSKIEVGFRVMFLAGKVQFCLIPNIAPVLQYTSPNAASALYKAQCHTHSFSIEQKDYFLTNKIL